MDMRKLLEAMTKFAGESEQKAGDQVKGTEPASGMLGELDKYSKDTAVERTLAERWEEFKEAAFKDTEEKRAGRKGSRPDRDYGKEGEPSKRYSYTEEETDESRGHKIIARKLKDLEAQGKPVSDEAHAKHIASLKKQQKEYLKKNPNSIYKQVDEVDAPTNPAADPNAVRKALAATSQLKAVTGTTAPAPTLAKALDNASQGKPVNSTDAKVIEPMMDIVTKAATDPKLANQFKSLAQQAKTTP